MKLTHCYMAASTLVLAGAIIQAHRYQTQLQTQYTQIRTYTQDILNKHNHTSYQHDLIDQISNYNVISISRVISLTWQDLMQTLAILIRSKISYLIAFNFVLSTLLVMSQSCIHRLFDSISDNERKACRDSLFRFAIFRGVMIAALVPLDLRDISVWLSFFAIIGVLHCCYIITRERFSTITVLPSATSHVFYQMIGVLSALVMVHLMIGLCTVVLFYRDTTISILVLLLYENVVAILMCLKMIGKYAIHVRDLNQAVQAWEERQAALVRCEFIFEAFAHLLTAAHCIHVWSFYGLSVTFIDLVLFLHLRSAALTFVDRCSKFHHYRRATAEINNRYPDATVEELRTADDTCAICREPLEQAKKLACNHFFHRNCLLTWLEYKSICPSCRAPLFNSSSWSHTTTSRTSTSPQISEPPTANQTTPPSDDNLEATMALIRHLQMEDAAALANPLAAVMNAAVEDRRTPRADVASAQARSLFHFDTRNISSLLPSFRFEVVSSSSTNVPPSTSSIDTVSVVNNETTTATQNDVAVNHETNQTTSADEHLD